MHVVFLTSVWALQPQALVKILIFNILNGKKLKKEKKQEICSEKKKNWFLKFAPNAGPVFYSEIKQVFSYQNTFLRL